MAASGYSSDNDTWQSIALRLLSKPLLVLIIQLHLIVEISVAFSCEYFQPILRKPPFVLTPHETNQGIKMARVRSLNQKKTPTLKKSVCLAWK